MMSELKLRDTVFIKDKWALGLAIIEAITNPGKDNAIYHLKFMDNSRQLYSYGSDQVRKLRDE